MAETTTAPDSLAQQPLRQLALYTSKVLVVFMTAAIFAAVVFFGMISPILKQVGVRQEPFAMGGEAKRFVKPDTASVSVGAQFTENDGAVAQKKADDAIALAKTEIMKLGVEENKIKTTQYMLQPNYDYQTGTRSPIKNYTMYVSIEVKTKDFGTLNKIVQAAVDSKLNVIYGINFELADSDKLKEELRNEAVADAKAKAEALSKQSGLHLGKLLNVVYNDSQFPSLPYGVRPLAIDSTTMEVPEKTVTSNVSPGENEIKQSVVLYYEIN